MVELRSGGAQRARLGSGILRAVRSLLRHVAGAFFPALFAITLGVASGAGAQDDFEPRNESWNGLSRVIAIAAENEVRLEVASRLDVGTLRPEDALIVVAPRQDLPSGPLTDFMRAGGRIALADDFGRGDSLLRTVRIERGRPNRTDALRLRGNDELLVAVPTGGHPLTQGVRALVTNHPQVVYHPNLEPIFAFGARANEAAVVLTGAIGSGRLVAIADPSVLINNMLEFEGNRRFAVNLLRYLDGGRGGRIVLVPPTGTIAGRFGEPSADRPLHDLRASLERVARAELPERALRVGAAALAGILLVLAAGMLPRSSPYVGGAMFARPTVSGGFTGRVEWYARRPANLGDPALAYKVELESELHRRLGLVGRVGIDEVIARMKAKGMASNDLDAARALLAELGQLQDELDHGTRGDALTEAHFRRIVRAGEALLDKLRRTAT